jgi:GTP-binding protein
MKKPAATKPVVAIIGRPNVGKSTLFNRIIQRREAIVHNQPGVTRDRNYAEAEWTGHEFILIDTGGYFSGSAEVIDRAVLRQVHEAIDEAQALIFCVDGRAGATALDLEIAGVLQKQGKPVMLAVNKIDDANVESLAAEFYKLGLGEPHAVAAANGRRIGDFLDELVQRLTEFAAEPAADEEKTEALRLAVVGRPNVGKSSFVNAVLGHEKLIVTEIPGTTRDAIDTPFDYHGQRIVLIDTAGLRKRSHVKESIEFYSTVRAREAIATADVALLLIDAQEGATDQDLHIVSEVVRLRKGLVIGVNKWDLIEKNSETAHEHEAALRERLRKFDYAPFAFISALKKQGLFTLVDLALHVHSERRRKIRTAALNEFLQKTIRAYPPPSMDRKEVKISYCTQVRTAPPVFAFYCNHPTSVTASYRQFLENRIRRQFGFAGVPLALSFRRK